MQDSHLRSILKAISWRILGTFGTITIAFVVTHKISISFYIGFFEFISKVGLFYLHERIWAIIPIGKSIKQKQKMFIKQLSSLKEEQI